MTNRDDMLCHILRAEEEYGETIRRQLAKAEEYVESVRRAQGEYLEKSEAEWRSFKTGESEGLAARLREYALRMEEGLLGEKGRFKRLQEGKMEGLSELLKGEVLSSYGGG